MLLCPVADDVLSDHLVKMGSASSSRDEVLSVLGDLWRHL